MRLHTGSGTCLPRRLRMNRMRLMGDVATGGIRAAAGLDLPSEQEIFERAPGENFSVASLVVGRRAQRHLLAIYGYARLVDQLGDAIAGNRLDALDALEADLDRVF